MPADAHETMGKTVKAPLHRPLQHWRRILSAVWRGSDDKNIALMAGGVTFYILLAAIPASAALLSLYGLNTTPHDIEHQVDTIAGRLLPAERSLVTHQLDAIVAADPRTLGIGILVGIIVAIYTMARGMGGMIDALNIAYGREERRGLIRFYLTAIGLVVAGALSIAVVAGLVAVATSLGIRPATTWLLLLAGLPPLTIYMTGVLAVLYRYGPDRADTDWEWTSPGAVLAACLWSVGTVLTYEYVLHFGDYNRVYGSLGGVMIFLSWLWSSIYLVILGAEMNGAIQRDARTEQAVRPTRH